MGTCSNGPHKLVGEQCQCSLQQLQQQGTLLPRRSRPDLSPPSRSLCLAPQMLPKRYQAARCCAQAPHEPSLAGCTFKQKYRIPKISQAGEFVMQDGPAGNTAPSSQVVLPNLRHGHCRLLCRMNAPSAHTHTHGYVQTHTQNTMQLSRSVKSAQVQHQSSRTTCPHSTSQTQQQSRTCVAQIGMGKG